MSHTLQVPQAVLDRIDVLEAQFKKCHSELQALEKAVVFQAKAALGVTAQLKAKFDRLTSEWKTFESPSSSAMDIAMHPAYQQIIGMGPIAVSWIIAELEKEPDHWFWALHCLSGGADPVSALDRGDLDAMSAAWVKWAKENGY